MNGAAFRAAYVAPFAELPLPPKTQTHLADGLQCAVAILPAL